MCVYSRLSSHVVLALCQMAMETCPTNSTPQTFQLRSTPTPPSSTQHQALKLKGSKQAGCLQSWGRPATIGGWACTSTAFPLPVLAGVLLGFLLRHALVLLVTAPLSGAASTASSTGTDCAEGRMLHKLEQLRVCVLCRVSPND